MDSNEIKDVSEIVKNSSETLNNLQSFFMNFFMPKGLDLFILKGHEKTISEYLENDDSSIEDTEKKIAFLSGYKKMVKEYRNRKRVTDMAVHISHDSATPNKVDEDWFDFFFDKVRLISDESFQVMWAKILADEIALPGKFSKSFMHTLSILSQKEAILFCNVSRFVMIDYDSPLKQEEYHPFIFVSKGIVAYENSGITRSNLLDLEQLGLIRCDFLNEYVFIGTKKFRIGNVLVQITGDPENKDKIFVGNVVFTESGKKLYSIVDYEIKKYNDAILKYTISRLKLRNCRIELNGIEN